MDHTTIHHCGIVIMGKILLLLLLAICTCAFGMGSKLNMNTQGTKQLRLRNLRYQRFVQNPSVASFDQIKNITHDDSLTEIWLKALLLKENP
jgi:hypothetical protein